MEWGKDSRLVGCGDGYGRMGFVGGDGRFLKHVGDLLVGRGSGDGRLGFVGGIGRFLKHVGEIVSRPWEWGRPIGFCWGIRPFLEVCWGLLDSRAGRASVLCPRCG